MARWKNIPKSKIGELLGVHRNTVQKLIARGELGGLTFPDVLEYVRRGSFNNGYDRAEQVLKEGREQC